MYTLIWFDTKNPYSASNSQQHTEKFTELLAAQRAGEEVWRLYKASYAYIWDGHRVVWEMK